MLQLKHEALRQMIVDASAQAVSREIAQYIVEHAASPRPPCQPRRGLGIDLTPGSNEQKPVDQQEDNQL
ncbi:UNVERIFIED_CONTAM: hypothetical protein Sradi_3204300 [Sesamum radiatum]|uniref:Uncharacterized protein n=1 Tax=Sesamum radiatum TaxID=300843 RepID=A0AAW2RG22_SESRA